MILADNSNRNLWAI